METTINPLDVVVVVILLISAVLAFMRGFVHEVLSIAAWIGAAFAALYGLPYAQPYARDLINWTIAADAGAFVFLFLVTLFALSAGTRAIAKGIQHSAFNNLDRSLGFVYGLARGAVVLCGFVLILEWLMTQEEYPAWIAEAKTLPLMEVGAETLRNVVPDSLRSAETQAREATDQLEEAITLQETLERLTSPEPAPADDSGRDGGYTDSERRQIDQLFQTTDPE